MSEIKQAADSNSTSATLRNGQFYITLHHITLPATYFLLALPAWYAEQGLYNGRTSVRLSVCPVDRQQQRRVAGLLLSAPPAGDIDRQRRAPGTQQQRRYSTARRSAANAGSVILRAEDRG